MPKSKANCLDPRTPDEDCTHEIRSKFTGRDILALGNGCMVSGDSNACGDPERIEKEDQQEEQVGDGLFGDFISGAEGLGPAEEVRSAD